MKLMLVVADKARAADVTAVLDRLQAAGLGQLLRDLGATFRPEEAFTVMSLDAEHLL